MDEVREYRQRLCASLEQQPAEYHVAFAALTPAQWPVPNILPAGYSAHKLMAHVRDVEVQAFLPRLYRIVNEQHPVLEAFPSHNWTEALYNPREPLTDLLADFTRARAEAVQLVRPLSAADWSRMAFHLASGKRTTQWWVERAYGHARDHLNEVLRIVWPEAFVQEK